MYTRKADSWWRKRSRMPGKAGSRTRRSFASSGLTERCAGSQLRVASITALEAHCDQHAKRDDRSAKAEPRSSPTL